jgi:hypothetical protein
MEVSFTGWLGEKCEGSTQGPTGVSVTFSVTSVAVAVPEPASLAILDGALLALGIGRNRRKNRKRDYTRFD